MFSLVKMELIILSSLKMIFFILLINLSFISNNKIVLPFKTKSNPGNDDNEDFYYFFNNEIYAEVEIGNPTQLTEIYLTTKTSYFIIRQNTSENQFYNSNKSSTYSSLFDETPYLDDVLKKGIPSTEKMSLQYSFNNMDKTIINNMKFNYGTKTKKVNKKQMGILGLQLFSSTYEKDINFITTLKQHELISTYVWSLNYTSQNEGFLIIGEYPHQYSPEKYNENYLQGINANIFGLSGAKFSINLNEICYGNKNFSSFKSVYFEPQTGIILGTFDFKKYIENDFFNDLIKKNQCQNKTYDDGEYLYFVCNEGVDLSKFKNVAFRIKDLSSHDFVLTKDDLFVKKGNKVYFLIVFGNGSSLYSWTLGKPFFRKFQLMFDQDKKQILYYSNIDDIFTVKNKKVNYLTWAIVGVLIIFVLILLFVVKKVILGSRKIHANELEDEFDYFNNNKKMNKLGYN